MQPGQAEPAVLDRPEGVSDDRPERLADDTLPTGTRPQPVAELALEADLSRSHPEDLDVTEHLVARQVRDAPVDIGSGGYVPAAACQPLLEVIWPGLGAIGHEAQAVAVGSLTKTGGVGVTPWPQPQPGRLEHRRQVVGSRRGRVGHDHTQPDFRHLKQRGAAPRTC